LVNENELGRIVITRLYNGGTPIIRYTGLNDTASIVNNNCNCGLNLPIIKNLNGRNGLAIVSPIGKILPPATIQLPLFAIANRYHPYLINRFQFIQKDIYNLEIKIILNNHFHDKLNVEKFINEVHKTYQKLLGETMNIKIKKVKNLGKNNNNHPPQIISRLNEKILKILIS
jgi:phenylacetate-coenzyme A ligase PaaK-like adenylate-forming protein